MFRGSRVATIDGKGRLKVPTEFRRLLEERYGAEFFLTSVRGDKALLYPLPVWEEIEARLGALPSSDPTRQRFLERVNYFGAQVRLDEIQKRGPLREHQCLVAFADGGLE